MKSFIKARNLFLEKIYENTEGEGIEDIIYKENNQEIVCENGYMISICMDGYEKPLRHGFLDNLSVDMKRQSISNFVSYRSCQLSIAGFINAFGRIPEIGFGLLTPENHFKIRDIWITPERLVFDVVDVNNINQ